MSHEQVFHYRLSEEPDSRDWSIKDAREIQLPSSMQDKYKRCRATDNGQLLAISDNESKIVVLNLRNDEPEVISTLSVPHLTGFDVSSSGVGSSLRPVTGYFNGMRRRAVGLEKPGQPNLPTMFRWDRVTTSRSLAAAACLSSGQSTSNGCYGDSAKTGRTLSGRCFRPAANTWL